MRAQARNIRKFVVGASLAFVCTNIASGQTSLGFSAVTANLDHKVLGKMSGGALTFVIGSREQGWSLRLGAERMVGNGVHTGIMCVDHIPPEGCNPQLIRDASTLQMITAGVGKSLFSTPRVWLSAFADVPLARVRADSHGQTTGTFFTAKRTLVGMRGGLHAGVVPVTAWPIAIELSGAAGQFQSVALSECADCYQPFTSAIGTRSAQIGVVWRPFNSRRHH